jgi:hypothetical protein
MGYLLRSNNQQNVSESTINTTGMKRSYVRRATDLSEVVFVPAPKQRP